MDKLKLDLQRFALDPPMAGNIIDEVCLHRYHQNIKRDYAKKNSDNNFANLVVDSIRSKNILNLMNFASQTANGITFTNNGDGSITINGTATQDFGVNFVLFKIKAGNYYLSINESSTLPNVFYLYDHDSNVGFGNGAITLSQDYNNMGFDTWITNGTSFNNITISPQLETGSTGTTFAPYQNLDNIILELFNDTSGSNWQDMMKNKLDYCINNINTAKVNTETFVNGGWSGVNFGFGIFSKIGNTYQLVWFSSNATYYCRKLGNNYDYTNITRQEIYSTGETAIGTWIDGKTLYRKVVSDTVSTTNGGWKEFNPFSSNEIDTIVSLVGTFTYASGATVSIPYTRTTGSNYSDREYILANVHKYNGTLSVVAYHPSNYSGLMSGQKFRIIVEYTKN